MSSARNTARTMERERRRQTRVPGGQVPHVTARVMGGPPVRIVDLSRNGAQIETTLHMRPGRAVTIRFLEGETVSTLTGVVVRSAVSGVGGSQVSYSTSLSFREELTVCPADPAATGFAEVLDAAADGSVPGEDESELVVEATGRGAASGASLMSGGW